MDTPRQRDAVEEFHAAAKRLYDAHRIGDERGMWGQFVSEAVVSTVDDETLRCITAKLRQYRAGAREATP